jgi:hypothetical protein
VVVVVVVTWNIGRRMRPGKCASWKGYGPMSLHSRR